MRLYNLLMVLLLSIITTQASYASSATLNLYGTVIEATCVVSQESKDRVVQLGQWNTNSLNGQTGKVTPPSGFKIYVQGCPAKTVSIAFSGEKSPQNSELLKLSAGSSAQNIAIEILDSNYSAIPLGNNSPAVKVDSTGNVGISFYARYKTVAPAVTAGSASADASFVLTYD